MIDPGNSDLWFVTGSQHLYGEETLALVADNTQQIAAALNVRAEIPLSRCAFVGDSTNDVWIAREAGFSIAFNPNSEDLEAAADVVVRSSSLKAILPYFR